MLAWRLCRERYAKLDGIGAAKVGGRWNPIGVPMVYMSATDALAVLEARVHLPRYIPETYAFVTAEIPDSFVELVENRLSLPADWSADLEWTRSIGRRFVDEMWNVALSVPSRVVPTSRNILLNANHDSFGQVLTREPKRFKWDDRLWDRVLGARQ